MWISRTSRGRRDLPLSRWEVEGIWVGWVGGALGIVFGLGFAVVVVGVGSAAAWLVVGGSGGGLAG